MLFRFSTYTRRDPKELYRIITLKILNNFFDWMLNQRRGKEGRRLRGTKHASSLGTYWKLYRLVYERATGEKIVGPMNRGMHKAVMSTLESVLSMLTYVRCSVELRRSMV
jgi:hypothetical protein